MLCQPTRRKYRRGVFFYGTRGGFFSPFFSGPLKKKGGGEKTAPQAGNEKPIRELEMPLMETFTPDTKRYKKELAADKKTVFRSTLFPASRPLVRGSNLEELITEIMYYIKPQ